MKFVSVTAAFAILLSACTAGNITLLVAADTVPVGSEVAAEQALADNADDGDDQADVGEPEGSDEAAVDADPEATDENDTPAPDATVPQYGSLPILDILFDRCAAGDLASCDVLYIASEAGSDYQAMAASCGDQGVEHLGTCEADLRAGGDAEDDDADRDTESDADNDDSSNADDPDVDPDSGDTESDGDVAGPDTDPVTFGDDPALDMLWTNCAAGDPVACDELFLDAPAGSEYEIFGSTCGGTRDLTSGGCAEPPSDGDDDDTESDPDPTALVDNNYGDHTGFDALWDACEAGLHDACDDLWGMSPIGSVYEAFGDTCGDTNVGASGSCSDVFNTDSGGDFNSTGYGDDPGLDAVYDSCLANGDEACDLLFDMSPIDSIYEAFALTCGDRRESAFDSCG